MDNKKNLYFSNSDIYCIGDVTNREVSFCKTVASGVVCKVKLDDIDWLISQLRKCQDRFTAVLDIENYYTTIFEDMSTEELVPIYNGLKAGNEFIETTPEFIDKFYKFKECEHLIDFVEATENVDSISELFEICDSGWVSIEKVPGTNVEYLEPWYGGEGNTDRHLIESIVNVVKDYDRLQIDELNKRFGLNIEYYGDYEKEERAKFEHE